MKYSFMALSKWKGKQKNMIMMMEYDGWRQNDYGDKRVVVLRDSGVIWVWGDCWPERQEAASKYFYRPTKAFHTQISPLGVELRAPH